MLCCLLAVCLAPLSGPLMAQMNMAGYVMET
jgi:hypothetical protein